MNWVGLISTLATTAPIVDIAFTVLFALLAIMVRPDDDVINPNSLGNNKNTSKK